MPQVGIDTHAAVCIDENGKIECVCGLQEALDRKQDSIDPPFDPQEESETS